MDLRQTKEYGEYLKRLGWGVERIDGLQIFIKKLPLVPWSVMKVQRFEGKIDWKKLEAIKKKCRVIYHILEPGVQNKSSDLEDRDYHLSKSPYLPTKTAVVDLRKSGEQLWKEMSKDARQQMKKDRVEIVKVGSREMKQFYRQWRRWGRGYLPSWGGFGKLIESFGRKARIVAGKREGGDDFLAGVVVLESADTAFYYFAWTSEEGKKLGAQYQLVWEEMEAAKKRGLAWWDFEGMEDGRWPRKSWRGFSTFKKKFGGEEISFPGSWRRWF